VDSAIRIVGPGRHRNAFCHDPESIQVCTTMPRQRKRTIEAGAPEAETAVLQMNRQLLESQNELVTINARLQESRAALERALSRWQTTFDAISDAIVLVTLDGVIVQGNAAMARLAGVPVDSLPGMSCCRIMHLTDKQVASCPVRLAKQTGTRQMSVMEVNGRTYEVTADPVAGPDGRPVNAVHVIKDVTEQLVAQENARHHLQQLYRADRLASIGMMVSGVAHEINNPNNLIMLNADVLSTFWRGARKLLERQRAADPSCQLAGLPIGTALEKIDLLVDGINSGSERIKRIVQNLRDFSQADTNEANQAVDLREVVESAVMMVNNLVRKSTERFTFDCPPAPPAVRGNRRKLQQVVINLLTNACQALVRPQQAVTVAVEAEPGSGTVAIRVRDEGVGIPRENLDRIMDPFFTTKREYGGTGLGLSVAYGIVKEHGGSVTVESETNAGTTVTIRLPAGDQLEK